VPYAGPERRHSRRAIRLLVVDDNADFRRLLQEWLGLCGFEVAAACNGLEALAVAGLVSPEIVLLDLAMPILDGFETTQRLRAQPATAKVPILAVTATVFEGARQQAEDAGVDAFVEKPADLERLLDSIRSFMPGGRPRRGGSRLSASSADHRATSGEQRESRLE
jgi:CheY-like chemotaxis protein